MTAPVASLMRRVREIYDQLSKRGIDVKFAIHPVAGRMPGHMNVLLAEAELLGQLAGAQLEAHDGLVGPLAVVILEDHLQADLHGRPPYS